MRSINVYSAGDSFVEEEEEVSPTSPFPSPLSPHAMLCGEERRDFDCVLITGTSLPLLLLLCLFRL